ATYGDGDVVTDCVAGADDHRQVVGAVAGRLQTGTGDHVGELDAIIQLDGDEVANVVVAAIPGQARIWQVDGLGGEVGALGALGERAITRGLELCRVVCVAPIYKAFDAPPRAHGGPLDDGPRRALALPGDDCGGAGRRLRLRPI